MILECGLVLLVLPKGYAIRLLPVLAVGAGLFLFRLTSEDYWQRMSTIQAPTEEGSANSRFDRERGEQENARWTTRWEWVIETIRT